ncbi:serine hydrolase domain-containing protein [Teichococcus vastitatis]|uniref:Serine hydrolase n=1 Tax=Teichococcus vastitatis TaxID=2307076 RepID=A0ABS9W9S5_9PROT|nr:serine hydrolase [Pseudoroseomonas vastitatis]MCI0756049.1 serine hydrolase [Pseudoroseomonas vastitatis]
MSALPFSDALPVPVPQEADPGDWPVWSSPEAAGWSTSALTDALRFASTLDSAALMLVVRGRVLVSAGRVAARFNTHSIRKSILSALIGIHEAEGRIDLGATLDALGIDDKLGLTPREKLATVYDLLCARSGVYHPSGYESPWMLSIKPARHSAGPGTTWCYNNWDFNALGSIFRQLTGADIFADFANRIAVPCGLQDFRPAEDGSYVTLPDSQHPAYPFRMTARDLAKFGQLFLDAGCCGGRAVLPPDWARLSVLPHSEAGHRGAYGFMWWISREGVMFPSVVTPPGSFAAFGTRGHKVLAMPSLQAVLVHRVDTDQEGTAVSDLQFGRLLARLLRAAPRH